MIYLASPYAKHPLGRQVAYERVKRVKGILEHKFYVQIFSPIEFGHPIDSHFAIHDEDFWLEFAMLFLRKSEALWLFLDQGWDKSSGMKCEVKEAQEKNIPIKIVKDCGHDQILLRVDKFTTEDAAIWGV